MPLNFMEQRVFDFIRRLVQSRHAAPTIDEIRMHCGLKSPASVCRILEVLESRGLIKRVAHVARGIELVGPDPPSFDIDGFEPEEDDEDPDALIELARVEAKQHTKRMVDPEIQRQANRYYKDWRERMITWYALQRQYMPHRSVPTGDHF